MQVIFNAIAQLDMKQRDAGMGSVRLNKEFIIHPDAIKQGLQTGEVFYVSKVGEFSWEKVRVRFCEHKIHTKHNY